MMLGYASFLFVGDFHACWNGPPKKNFLEPGRRGR
jgi:hypothetical protein